MNRMTIQRRILLIVAFLIVSFVATVSYSLFQYSALIKQTNKQSDKVASQIEFARSAQVHFKIQVQEWKNILLRGQTAEGYKKSVDGFEKNSKKTQELLQKLKQTTAGGEYLDRDIGKKIDAFLGLYETLNNDYRQTMKLYLNSPAEQAHLIADKAVHGKDREPSKIIDETVETVLKQSELIKADSEKAQQSTAITLVAISIFVISLNIIAAIFAIRAITSVITSSVITIKEGTEQITSASAQVASSATSLATGASKQASSVEEITATIEQSSSIVAQNSQHAKEADKLAKTANNSAAEGFAKGQMLVSSMEKIIESASKIANIIKTIDQIAFQTNLLALNAAVEAARAGEHGLGFAVVAEEVRNLAKRAALAAKETSEIIEEAIEQIKKGNDIAAQTNESFRQIVEQAGKVSALITQMATTSDEQAHGIGQISQAMTEVDDVTQHVAANSEEAAAAAEELSAQADATFESVRVLGELAGMSTESNGQKAEALPRHL